MSAAIPTPADYPHREFFASLDLNAPVRTVLLDTGAWPGGLMADLLHDAIAEQKHVLFVSRDEATLNRCAAAFRLLIETAGKDPSLH